MFPGYFKIKIIKANCMLKMQVLEMDECLREKNIIFKNNDFGIVSTTAPDITCNTLFLRGEFKPQDNHISVLKFKTNTARDLYLAQLTQCVEDYKKGLKNANRI